ncbi:hypothetical protein KP509_36G048200 [Ceratopteris richardii]|uniref:Methenyltetrahydrofolate cyclohydrolase n=1 Tax=Ceratopteris richardii TaxID=49495 RepID=A0A8T2QC75_CERRI|nr:hypothetical protein KP509_36G048200 [Ceratopteris richardii]
MRAILLRRAASAARVDVLLYTQSFARTGEILSSSLLHVKQMHARCICFAESAVKVPHASVTPSVHAGNLAHYKCTRSYASDTDAYLSLVRPLSSNKLSSIGFHRVGIPILGVDSPEIWTHHKDLRPCQAILDEVSKVEPSVILIDGKLIAERIKQEVAEEVARVKSQTAGKVPGLAMVLVGLREDAKTYVWSKKKACKEVGIESFEENLPEDSSEEEVVNVVGKFNDDPSVHGILVQLPLPKHINEERVLAAVNVEKDVDGFHPLNIGKLAMQGRSPLFVPCTPRGCIELLLRSNIDIKGKHAVVIGRSNIVGTPAAMLLQQHQATVSVVHSYTPNPAEITNRADIVIAAAGVAHLVRGDWIKPGAVVIDVGINLIEDPSAKKGYRLVGDVCFKEAVTKASAITPVPGGVGPMTIAMLLCNTLESAKRAFGISDQ